MPTIHRCPVRSSCTQSNCMEGLYLLNAN
uniref:Uncharacterized protein n=1 Tax=Arundo donax TaxID=35708 RepID=A0A0A9AX77_ARUDO